MPACLLALLLSLPAQGGPAPVPAPASVGKLDGGLLDPAWFGPSVRFDTRTLGFDFLYLKPGLALKGRSVRLAPWEPLALPTGRRKKDLDQAQDVNARFPGFLEEAFKAKGGGIRAAVGEGDLLLVGRIVDYQAGNLAKQLLLSEAVGRTGGIAAGEISQNLPATSGRGWITWDLKLLDPATGEVLAAAHHRLRVADVRTSYRGLPRRWAKRFAALLAERAR